MMLSVVSLSGYDTKTSDAAGSWQGATVAFGT